MPLARTSLLGQISNGSGNFGAGAFTTNAFTPPDNSLLVVMVQAIENGGVDPLLADLTISGGGLTFANQVQVSEDLDFSDAVRIYTAPVVAGASMTLTMDCGTRSIGEYAVSVEACTGHHPSSPVGATATGHATSGFSGPPDPVALTLSGAPAPTSLVFAAMGMCKAPNPGTTQGAGWTELQDLNNTDWGGLQTQVRGSSTSTSVDWADIRAGGGSLFNYAAAAIEIKANTVTAAALAGSITAAGATNKQTAKTLTGTTTAAAAMAKVAAKALAGTATATAALTRAAAKVLTGQATPAGAVRKILTRIFGGAATGAGSVTTALPTPVAADITHLAGPQRATHIGGPQRATHIR